MPDPPRSIDLTPGRVCDNECILFDEARQLSWIVYPPRSAYDFLQRPSKDTTIVEYHPWTPYAQPVHHALQPRIGCKEHGLDCGATLAIQAAVDLGWDPFK